MTRIRFLCGLAVIGLAVSACAGMDKTAKPPPDATTHTAASGETSTPSRKANAAAPPGTVEKPRSVAMPDATACVGKNVEVLEEQFTNGNPKARREVIKLDDGTLVNHGKTTLFWEAGGKKTEFSYVCGARHGQKRTWHTNGKKWQEGGYFANRDHGTWTEWYGDGSLARRWSMTYGAWHGMYTEWYPDGIKRLEVEWVNGMKQGVETLRDEFGNVGLTTVYVDNVPQPGHKP